MPREGMRSAANQSVGRMAPGQGSERGGFFIREKLKFFTPGGGASVARPEVCAWRGVKNFSFSRADAGPARGGGLHPRALLGARTSVRPWYEAGLRSGLRALVLFAAGGEGGPLPRRGSAGANGMIPPRRGPTCNRAAVPPFFWRKHRFRYRPPGCSRCPEHLPVVRRGWLGPLTVPSHGGMLWRRPTASIGGRNSPVFDSAPRSIGCAEGRGASLRRVRRLRKANRVSGRY